ncbi:hypothetical protein O9G_002106 [Rozella allomycis CSF55]|uniref:Uncharacterized protein n=1 Tax=Rozella allomycis (strain CSF55) TaxID=988480 RepID=A0A075B2K3_ROZAC|nr:hypothetical protein O9G_002106 [Rozella allomycis CSF55]|eukprot:EPZ36825.1 hypothetical protein O9G_002106 [Rozella allomycis CSF55]
MALSQLSFLSIVSISILSESKIEEGNCRIESLGEMFKILFVEWEIEVDYCGIQHVNQGPKVPKNLIADRGITDSFLKTIQLYTLEPFQTTVSKPFRAH